MVALLSNIIFERLIINDFNDYILSNKEDHIYWIMASVEGSYKESGWDSNLLTESLHWGIMLGFETYVVDNTGKKVFSSTEFLSDLNPNMLKRMEALFELPYGLGEFTWYPLFVRGEEIGKLYVRPLKRLGLIPLKEEIFRKRGREFLIISFLLAGSGASILAVLITLLISNPIRRLTTSSEKISRGDFSVKVRKGHGSRLLKHRDEIDRLTYTFNYMAEALRREDALRKHLSSNIAHELRTPLTIIKGNLEAIEDGVISDPEKVIKDISIEIQRIISLVEGIEDITRAEASFFNRGEIKEIDIKKFVESVISGMREVIADKGLSLDINGSSFKVKTYPEKLHIILKNLLTNAYKFTTRGGITINWDRYREKEKEGFYISIEDTGEGIAEDDIKKVFKRFYKGRDSDGRGLGLSIVREILDVLGGRIEVESQLERGSRFTVIL